MTRAPIPPLALLPLLLIAGCAELRDRAPDAPADATAAVVAPEEVESEDTADGDAKAAASAPAAVAAGGMLGTTIASLGDPGQGGMWIKTPLVRAPGKGTVGYNGQSVAVDLIPIDDAAGSGSRMSLAAFQALGAPITGLPEITVSMGG